MSRKRGLNKPTMRPYPTDDSKLSGAQRKAQLSEWRPKGKTVYGVKHTGGRGKSRA